MLNIQYNISFTLTSPLRESRAPEKSTTRPDSTSLLENYWNDIHHRFRFLYHTKKKPSVLINCTKQTSVLSHVGLPCLENSIQTTFNVSVEEGSPPVLLLQLVLPLPLLLLLLLLLLQCAQTSLINDNAQRECNPSLNVSELCNELKLRIKRWSKHWRGRLWIMGW